MFAFGSYGWSDEGVDNIMDRLMQARMKVMEGLKIKFRPSNGEIEQCVDFGMRFADAVNTGVAPALTKRGAPSTIDYEALNLTGQVVLWRWTVSVISTMELSSLRCARLAVGGRSCSSCLFRRRLSTSPRLKSSSSSSAAAALVFPLLMLSANVLQRQRFS